MKLQSVHGGRAGVQAVLTAVDMPRLIRRNPLSYHVVRVEREWHLRGARRDSLDLAHTGRYVALLRSVYGRVQQSHPFETVAIWRLPQHDSDYSQRWRLIKKYFSSALPTNPSRSTSKITKREKGIWQRRFWEQQIRGEATSSTCTTTPLNTV